MDGSAAGCVNCIRPGLPSTAQPPRPCRKFVQNSAIRPLSRPGRSDNGGLALMNRTLVVDDSPTMRRMVMASLRDVCAGGFAEAGSGLEAIEQLALGPIDLMVLDLNMPDMHGLDVLKFLRAHQAFRTV